MNTKVVEFEPLKGNIQTYNNTIKQQTVALKENNMKIHDLNDELTMYSGCQMLNAKLCSYF